MDRIPVPGEFYRHFKNKIYQIICLAHHSETDETLVVYQALYGDFKICARPLDMFISEVDHEKYPDVIQKYRFEKISREDAAAVSMDVKKEKSDIGDDSIQSDADSRRYSDVLDRFLDADNLNDKLNILEEIKNHPDTDILSAMAVSLDLNIGGGTPEEQYEQMVFGLKTRMRFENTRLR